MAIGGIIVRCLIATSVLRAHLGVVAGALMPRGTRPEWSKLQIAADHSVLTLTIENPQFGITTKTTARVTEPGMACVPARLLIEFLGSVDDVEIELQYNMDRAVLAISCSAYDPHIRGLTMPAGAVAASMAERFAIPAEVLLEAIRDTYYGAGTDEHHPVLTGVQLQLRRSGLCFTATDGSRLVQRRSPVTGDLAVTEDVLVPAKALQEALRVFADESGDLSIGLSESHNQMSISSERSEMRTRLLSGAYPDVARLIGLQGATTVRVAAAELERKVRATNLFATESDHVIRVSVGSGAVRLVASTQEVGDIDTAVDAEVRGPDCRVAVNGRYILDVCARIGGRDAEVHLTDEDSPVIVRRHGDRDFQCVILPMRISAW
jgi:DNA polymerase-3 subunit beta